MRALLNPYMWLAERKVDAKSRWADIQVFYLSATGFHNILSILDYRSTPTLAPLHFHSSDHGLKRHLLSAVGFVRS